MKTPRGFSFSGVASGIKPQRKDLGLVFSEMPCAAAGCFTSNQAKAAPVQVCQARLPAEGIRAVLLNSGNANALTGQAGVEDVKVLHRLTAQALNIPEEAVISASTGVLGMRFPVHKVEAALPRLLEGLARMPDAAAEAIITTDTRIKLASRTLELGGREVTLSAIAKGSGMIAPQLATVLAVVVTDCAISPLLLEQALRKAMPSSFNSLTVDNEMSTNDAVLMLANGLAGNSPLVEEGPDFERLTAALTELCVELAKDVAADGEGATKVFEVELAGAPSEEIARDLARSIAGSPLVKAAMFGADPNWGRILATVGARAGVAGYPIDPAQATVILQGTTVYKGEPVPFDAAALKGKLRGPEVTAQVILHRPNPLPGGDPTESHRATAWGCDLTYDYVKINADYTSLIIPREDGGVGRDDRLGNYSPSFKRSLLVEALSYISRFAGQRCVVKYGGAAMVKESLKRSFCNDINLLRSVGLQPIVVHGGGPEIARQLEKLGRRVDFVDGARLSETTDVHVLEVVLTGAVNTELVTLLNREGGHAVGVSGKDGALLRARRARSPDGKDPGARGEVVSVNRAFLEMLLSQGYVPVVSPVGIGEGGESFQVSADQVASEIAAAIGASKLIYLTDVQGILDGGSLLPDLNAQGLSDKLSGGAIAGGMVIKAHAILKALSAGVERVHVIDGRVPHNLIAELFTDRGVGTLVTA